jgi:hypothetical protein
MAKLDLTITITQTMTMPSAPTNLQAAPMGGPPASTTVALAPAAPFSGSGGAFSAAAPIASGATVGTVVVTPTNWQGNLALSGANAAAFALSGNRLVTAAALAVGTYTLAVTATP